jgi:hypothetical protein
VELHANRVSGGVAQHLEGSRTADVCLDWEAARHQLPDELAGVS